MVTKRSRVVTIASAPINTQGSGQSVNASHRRLPSLVYGIRRLQRLEVDDVVGYAEAVIAEIICGLGDFDDFTRYPGRPG